MCVCMWSKDSGGLHVCVEGRVRDHVCVFVFVFVFVCVCVCVCVCVWSVRVGDV